jgi:glycosyltransferase involved in cell wall biosynthesis
MAQDAVELSVVVPVYGEAETLEKLQSGIRGALDPLGVGYEVLYVDDGSRDGSFEAVMRMQRKDARIRAIRLIRNFGKSAALEVGFRRSRGRFIAQIDADLQNDPADIPRLMEKLQEGYDSVIGWRYDRKDPYEKRFFSRLANGLRRLLVGDPVHDSVCGIAVHRRESVEGIHLWSDTHRYLPGIIHLRGYRVSELKVKHSARRHGISKYGPGRLVHGFFDLLEVRFLWRRHSGERLDLRAVVAEEIPTG